MAKAPIIADFAEFSREIGEIFSLVRGNREGRVADYIPELKKVDPELFSVAICTADGQTAVFGDVDSKFCLQSVMKPVNYCICLNLVGEELTHRYIGREPSGRGFNELTLNKEGRPHNPLINAGAIVGCSLLRPELALEERLQSVRSVWQKLSGDPGFDLNESVYQSERQTADRNFALAYFMRENQCFPPNSDLMQTLELYFQCCSIETTPLALAKAAAGFANAGVNPLTQERVFQTRTVQNALSLMMSCGLYDFSGEFAFSIGLPAKSGVSGAMMVVVPQVLGLAIFSPRLDSMGNSVRGIAFCRELVKRFNFHVFDFLSFGAENTKRDPRFPR